MTAGPNDRAGFTDVPVNLVPARCAMKTEIPMPTGARKVARCFSTARKYTVNTNCAVRNISKNNPWATLISCPRLLVTWRGPGRRPSTTAAAAIPATI
jgi:hypothetical protein